jgi:hypothetical protein
LVHRDPRAGGQSARDQALRRPEFEELKAGHVPVLAARQVQDPGVEADFEAMSFTIRHY